MGLAISYAQTGPLDRFASFFGMDSDEFAVGQEAEAAAQIPANPDELKSAVVANELGGPKSVVDRLKERKETVEKHEQTLAGLNTEKTSLLAQLEKLEAEIEKANSDLRLANGALKETEEEKKMALTQGATQVLMTAQKDLKEVEQASEQQGAEKKKEKLAEEAAEMKKE